MNNAKNTRMCAACRKRFLKSELLRIAKNKDGYPVFDEKQDIQSRGLYICKNEACIEKAFKINAVNRGLRCKYEKQKEEDLKELLKKFE